MKFRKKILNPIEEKDIVEPSIEDLNIKMETFDIPTKAEDKEENILNVKINENLLKLIEDIVLKTINKNKPVVNNTTRINQRNLKILEQKVKNHKIISKSRVSFKKVAKKKKIIEQKVEPIKWIKLK